jgi:hypothetical protein
MTWKVMDFGTGLRHGWRHALDDPARPRRAIQEVRP